MHKNSSENDQKGIPVQLSSLLEGHFSTLAYQCVQIPISLLRAQQIKIKKQLIQDYEKHEQLATKLSCDLKTNRDEYLLHLDKLIQITHHLGYVTENNHYQSANNILTLRRAVLLEDNKTPNTRKNHIENQYNQIPGQEKHKQRAENNPPHKNKQTLNGTQRINIPKILQTASFMLSIFPFSKRTFRTKNLIIPI